MFKKKGMYIWLAVALCAAAGSAMPPLPGVEIPAEARELRHRLNWDVATRPVRDAHKSGISIQAAGPLVSGTKKFSVVLMQYPNLAKVYNQTDFQQMLFGSWTSGSAHDYYTEVSYGLLNLTGTVSGWYTTINNRSYYAANTGNLIQEAAANADPTVNFADFDNDGDGYVDCFSVVHSGYGMEETGNPADIWSHMWYVSAWFGAPYVTNDPDPNHPGQYIKIDLYTVEPERSNVTNYGTMITIGVFCHEWGHAFGLPDLYDTNGGGQGLGYWCLMAAGSWGGNGGSPWKPVHMSAWPKYNLGWLTPTLVTVNNTYPVRKVETNPECYRLWTGGSPTTEYFLIENRQKTNFDQLLRNSGLLIYHIDETVINLRAPNNEVNAGGAYPYGVALEQADGQNHLWTGANRGDVNDPYPGGLANTAFDSLGTNPDSRSNAGINTRCGVNQVPASDSVMSPFMYIGSTVFDVGVLAIDEPADTAVCTNYTYELQGTVANYGSKVDSTFPVTCTIDSAGVRIYTSTAFVPGLAASGTATVLFDTWTTASAPGVVYTITMTTGLPSDTKPDNNSQTKQVTTATGWDVATVSIDAPADTILVSSI